MWDKLKHKLLQTPKIAGVEYVRQADGTKVYHVVVLERKKDEANFLFQKIALQDLDQLKEILGEDVPIILCLNIKGIIHRKMEQSFDNPKDALTQVLSTADPKSFYLQQHNLAEGAIISIVRQNIVEELLQEFKSVGLSILDIYLGTFLIEFIYANLPETATLQTDSQTLYFEEKQLQSFESNSVTPTSQILVGDQQVVNRLLPALAAAYLAFANIQQQNIQAASLTSFRSEFAYKRLFRGLGIGLLGFFFIALLANYLLFSHYQEENKGLSFELGHKELALQNLDSLKAQYQRNQALLGGQVQLLGSRVSFYADQLAASLPSTIQLTQLTIFPRINEDDYGTEDDIPQYDKQVIRIQGNCRGSVFYNNWKHALTELHWIKSIHNVSYQNVNEDIGQFELELTIE